MRSPGKLTGPLGVSLLLHIAAVAAFVFVKAGGSRPAMPQSFRVHLTAAPAGPREIGVVSTAPTPRVTEPPPKTTPRPTPQKTPAKTAPKRTQPVAKATQTVAPPKTDTKTAQPKAGGGPEGGKGTDVANVNLDEGINFPFPGYLQNIVNQVAKRFLDGRTWPANYRVEIRFLIKRDGGIMDQITIVDASQMASYAFKKAAEGAIVSVGNLKLFGPLPDGFTDDVLPVVFSFDPRIMK